MILNTSEELKQAGFDSSLLGFDDVEKDGADKTALDRFLDSSIQVANSRLAKWVPEIKQNHFFKLAEFNLTLVQILPFVWARGSVGVVNLSIEGMQMTISRPSEDEKKNTISNLLMSAENSVSDFLATVEAPSIYSHD